jgi:hypothetical protein
MPNNFLPKLEKNRFYMSKRSLVSLGLSLRLGLRIGLRLRLGLRIGLRHVLGLRLIIHT